MVDEVDIADVEFGAMDYIAFLIKDELPAEIVINLFTLLDEIPGVKHIQDFKAFVMIEFATNKMADAAKKEGFVYKYIGQDYTKRFSSMATVSNYLQDKFNNPNIGTGY